MKDKECLELKHRLNHSVDGYSAFHGFHYEMVSSTKVVVSLMPTKEILNPMGMVHGGALFGLADTAAGILCRAAGRPSVTLKGSLDYFKGVKMEKIYASATFLHQTKRTSALEVRIENQHGELMCHGVFNYYRMPKDAKKF